MELTKKTADALRDAGNFLDGKPVPGTRVTRIENERAIMRKVETIMATIDNITEPPLSHADAMEVLEGVVDDIATRLERLRQEMKDDAEATR